MIEVLLLVPAVWLACLAINVAIGGINRFDAWRTLSNDKVSEMSTESLRKELSEPGVKYLEPKFNAEGQWRW